MLRREEGETDLSTCATLTGLGHEFNDVPKVCQAFDQAVFLPLLSRARKWLGPRSTLTFHPAVSRQCRWGTTDKVGGLTSPHRCSPAPSSTDMSTSDAGSEGVCQKPTNAVQRACEQAEIIQSPHRRAEEMNRES